MIHQEKQKLNLNANALGAGVHSNVQPAAVRLVLWGRRAGAGFSFHTCFCHPSPHGRVLSLPACYVPRQVGSTRPLLEWLAHTDMFSATTPGAVVARFFFFFFRGRFRRGRFADLFEPKAASDVPFLNSLQKM